MKTYVYVISGDHGRQKIGCSDDPAQRIRNLQTGSPFPLKFEFIGEVENGAGGQVEVEAHFSLRQHQAPGGDEWFVVPPDVAITAVMAAAHRLGYRCKPVDIDAIGSKSYSIGRPSWHKWARVPPVLFGLYWLVPILVQFNNGEVSAYYVLGAWLALMAMILVAQWMIIKTVELFLAFDRFMHPDDVKVPLSLD